MVAKMINEYRYIEGSSITNEYSDSFEFPKYALFSDGNVLLRTNKLPYKLIQYLCKLFLGFVWVDISLPNWIDKIPKSVKSSNGVGYTLIFGGEYLFDVFCKPNLWNLFFRKVLLGWKYIKRDDLFCIKYVSNNDVTFAILPYTINRLGRINYAN